MKSIYAETPGKIILFGEHAVVYGYPAIASAVSLFSRCFIKESSLDGIKIELKDYNIIYKSKNIISLKKKLPKKFRQIGYCLENFEEQYDIELANLTIQISSSLFPNAGLGSSASTSVALVQALASYYKLKLTKSDISKFAFQLEKIVHGNPSGIDNTICTFGNMIFYKKSNFKFIKPEFEFPILITNTNIMRDTKKAINIIKDLKDSNPKRTKKNLHNIGKITEKAKDAINKGNINQIGKLMNKNQEILEKLQVSNNTISKIRSIALENGAIGTKLTGAGLGGCVISIGKDPILENINSILSKNGFKGFITKVNKIGVKVERKN